MILRIAREKVGHRQGPITKRPTPKRSGVCVCAYKDFTALPWQYTGSITDLWLGELMLLMWFAIPVVGIAFFAWAAGLFMVWSSRAWRP